MPLDLIGEQEELVEAMVALGKPVIVYLMNGRPLSINYIAIYVPAIIEGWYMWQETGTAAADILFGDVNTGNRRGDEITQLYIHQKVASVTRPVMELKGFERFSLEAGETKKVSFIIDKSKLAFWDYKMNYTFELGQFEIVVGKSSGEYLKKALTVE